MMRNGYRGRRGIPVLVMALALVLSACSTGVKAPAQTIEWRFQSILTAEHFAGATEIWFAEQVKEKTGGRLNIEVIMGGGMGIGGPQVLRAVGDGLMEAGQMLGNFASGDTGSLTEVMEVPFLVPYDIAVRKKVAGKLIPYWEPVLRERGAEIIAVGQLEARNVYASKPITTLADLKGLKVRTVGPAENDFSQALGMLPVAVDFGEVNTALQQGVVDAFWLTHSATFSSKLFEVAKYAYETPQGGGTWFIIANKKQFDALPPDIQTIVKDLGRQASDRLWDQVKQVDETYRKKMMDLGLTVTKATDTELSTMRSLSDDIWTKWAARAAAPGQEMLKVIQDTVKEAGY